MTTTTFDSIRRDRTRQIFLRALRKLKSRELAEDVCAELWIKVWRAWCSDESRVVEDPSRYLSQALTSLLADHAQKARKFAAISLGDLVDEDQNSALSRTDDAFALVLSDDAIKSVFDELAELERRNGYEDFVGMVKDLYSEKELPSRSENSEQNARYLRYYKRRNALPEHTARKLEELL